MAYFDIRNYTITIIFLILLFSLVFFLFALSYMKYKKLWEAGFTWRDIYREPRLIFARMEDIYRDSPFFFARDKEKVDIIPKQVDPYEFYCSHCDITSIGYEVYCQICGRRMRQPSLASLEPDNDENATCVICHQKKCPECDRDLYGEEPCFEECPYCESAYHKHCWIKTMKVFGKCGHCLENPPPELEKLDIAEIKEELTEEDIIALYEVETGKHAKWRGKITQQFLKWREKKNL